MTVIAWDGKTLAADRMASDAWMKCNSMIKIREINGNLVGGCGSSTVVREMMVWFSAGALPDQFPPTIRALDNIDLLVITPGRAIHLYQNGPYPIVLDQATIALGSGKEVATAVMMLGHDARKAVELANVICPGCGNGIDTLELA